MHYLANKLEGSTCMPRYNNELLRTSQLHMQLTLTAYKRHQMHRQQMSTPDLHV